MKLSMPEELLLLMLDDETGRLQERAAPAGDYALAGAVLAELAVEGRIHAEAGAVTATDPTPTGDALLDGWLARIAAEAPPRDARHWIEALGAEADPIREALFARLVQGGVLREEEGRFLWVFPERRYPQRSGSEEREVKARLMGVLFDDHPPSHHDALLVGLCRAAGLFPLIFASHELDHLEPRIEAVANTEALNRAVMEAIQEIYAQIARYAPMI